MLHTVEVTSNRRINSLANDAVTGIHPPRQLLDDMPLFRIRDREPEYSLRTYPLAFLLNLLPAVICEDILGFDDSTRRSL